MRDIDTSYSGIDTAVQGGPKVGKKLALEMIDQMRFYINKKEQLEKDAKTAEINANQMKLGIDHIAKHLAIRPPFYIIGDSNVYEVNHQGVKEHNSVLK